MTLIDRLQEALLLEFQNTLGADVNEILMGYYVAGENWNMFDNPQEVQLQLKKRKKEISSQEYKDQDGRAREMAKEALEWARENKYKGKVVKVYWTARSGVLQKAVGKDVDQRKNPTDILIKFSDGKFLGLSAKSTGQSGDIGFKNPGLGHIEKEFGLDLYQIVKDMELKAVKKYKLPPSAVERKHFIREHPDIQVKTIEYGTKILTTLRDAFMNKLKELSQEDLRKYVLKYWLDVDENIFPYYIKITGRGKSGNYSADVHDPLNNPKLKKVMLDKLELEPGANTYVGLVAGGKKILKMRFKYESEKLGSPVKMSGDPFGSKEE